MSADNDFSAQGYSVRRGGGEIAGEDDVEGHRMVPKAAEDDVEGHGMAKR